MAFEEICEGREAWGEGLNAQERISASLRGKLRCQSAKAAARLLILKTTCLNPFLHLLRRAKHFLVPQDSLREEKLQLLWRFVRNHTSSGTASFASQPRIWDVVERVRASKGAVVFLPSIPWSSDLFQRPHHLARWFAREGYVAIFDSTCAGPLQDDVSGFKEIEPNLYLYRGSKSLLAKLPQATLWSFPYNFHLKNRYPARFQTVYDWMDALEVFYHHGREFIDANHLKALSEATVIATVTRTLRAEAIQIRPDAVYLPNGVDYDHFAVDSEIPNDPAIARLRKQGKPIACYYGALASWFNFSLLEAVARLRPDWNFLLIGPQLGSHLEGNPLMELPNVTWIGPRNYKTLPGYLKLIDVAMIPFKVNEITKGTSPLKLYEFFASGKPTVTTPIPECGAYPEVHEAATAEEFASALDLALKESKSSDFCARLREIGRTNSWSDRVRKVAEPFAELPVEQPDQGRRPKDLVKGALRRGVRILLFLSEKSKFSGVLRRLKRLVTKMFPVGTPRGQSMRLAVQKARRVKSRILLRPRGPSLSQILRENSDRKGIVIYPPLIDWTWMTQRPQQLMAQFARAGYLSLFCSPRNRSDRFDGFKQVDRRLYLCDSLDSLYEISDTFLLIGWIHHWKTAKLFRSPRVIYDYLDDLRVATEGAEPDPAVLELHRKLVTKSEIVLATARRLYDEVKQQRPDALYCPNGVDYEHFHLSSSPQTPPDIADFVESGRPIIGYYGAMAQWFDYDLLKYAATVRKDFRFVLIGPDYDGSINNHARLLRMPNVRWLGEKKYEKLPAYLHHFAVATIPFVINDITRATSPVKLFEYMAGGKPVVTTKMPECRSQPCVLTAGSPAEFVEMLNEAIRLGGQASYREMLDRQARANTWEARLETIVSRIESLGGGTKKICG